MKRTFGLILLIISLVFLVLGLYYPFMTIKIEVQMPGDGGFLGNLIGGSIAEQFNSTKKYNIPQAMKMLFENEQYFVGVLIGLFAVVLPIAKTIMSFVFLYNKNIKLYNFMGMFGKFAMADVFCVGVFVAFLYTKFNSTLKADIEIGYYYFALYVILNIISLILLKPTKQKE
jgi:uncharacterized paraquat-inducible protein A